MCGNHPPRKCACESAINTVINQLTIAPVRLGSFEQGIVVDLRFVGRPVVHIMMQFIVSWRQCGYVAEKVSFFSN